ncbi:hypothetical protein ANSO36C_32770 [Nostoc cf. commune SO-36]|uniref:Uncharacterized protein n=1 Tax=Nostoc cf. commune SO-36 TaxID=449208 RepID=A0ABM7Z3A5_NOSCO|nr:hypothetical protein ANSO36C_32770 [Nostoc cf. commune SO-36]
MGRMGVVMQTSKLSFEECNLTMAKDVEQLALDWQQRLAVECPEQNEAARQSIILWLYGI